MLPRCHWKQTLAVAVALLVASLTLDFNHFQRQQTADSLLPVLNSLLHWTPFFWGQHYYGMLWAWLTQGVQHPLYNFALHNALVFYCSLAVHFALASYLYRQPASLVLGASSASALLGLTSHHWSFTNLAPMLFYGTPLLFGIGALALLEVRHGPGRHAALAAAMGLLSLAAWVNLTTPLLLGVLLLARQPWGRQLDGRLLLRQLLATTYTLLVGIGLMLYAQQHERLSGPSAKLLPLHEWPHALWATTHDCWVVINDDFAAASWLGMPPLLLLLGITLGLGAVLLRCSPAARRDSQQWLPIALKTLLLSGVLMLVLGMQQWNKMSDYAARYWYPPLCMAQICLLAVGILPAYRLLCHKYRQARGWLDGSALTLLCLICVLRFGVPSAASLRADLDTWAGTYTNVILANQVNFIGGDYWQVWPAVFHANWRRYEQQPDTPVVWGLANKCSQSLRAVPPATWQKPRFFIPRQHETQFFNAFGGMQRFKLLQRQADYAIFTSP